jgi:dipeptidyl aminopeptidase/acylaminoacyl peptidase
MTSRFLVSIFLLGFGALPALLAAERFTLDHPGKVVRVADPQLSPKGDALAVIVSRANYVENRFDPEIILIDPATKAQRILTHGRRGLSQIRWSPDGAHLAFLATVDGKSQVFALPINGGEAWQVTKAVEGVQQYAWRPNGKQIAYVMRDPEPKKEGAAVHLKAFEVRNNDYLIQQGVRPSHIWLVNVDGGGAKRLTSGSWSVPVSLPPSSPSSPLSWSPDGKHLAIVKNQTPYTGDAHKSTVQILDAESGEMRPLTGRADSESQPQFSPDGQKVLHWYPRDGQSKNVNEIYLGGAGGGETSSITRALDRNIQRAIWMPDGQHLLVSANDGVGVGLWLQPLDSSKPARKLDTGDVVPTAAFWLDASVGPSGQIAFTGSAPQSPAEVYWLPSLSAAAKPVRLTEFNKPFESLELGRSEKITWTTDGFPMDGVLTYPPDFRAGAKYPLVLYIHGGPRSASKLSFSPRAQLLAAQGWLVFEPNYRGSDNLGNAFQAAIQADTGAGPGRDCMGGVAELVRRGFVDESRMAVSGWSYGGYMTTWLLGNYPDKWKAAVAGAAVTDWLDQYNMSDANVRRGLAMGGSPWTSPDRMKMYLEQSPITHAPRIKAPTLILALMGDYRVTPTQSYKLYHALADNNVPTQFIAYPLPGHSPTDPVHMKDVDRRWIDWLLKYLR